MRRADSLYVRGRALDAIFAPHSVAIIGATEKPGSVGQSLVRNLQEARFKGALYAVNPKHPTISGLKSYPNIAAVPEKVDLAVIVTPSQTVPAIVNECVEAGVHGAIIISAGFKECGPQGAQLEREIMAAARRGSMRIIGPNCLGVMVPSWGLNATFAQGMARPGQVGFISQSGALCTAILDWSFGENVGFSAFMSIGSMLDVGWGDLIYYLGDDPHTRSIVIYMETIGDARSFLSAAREVALTKPIIVIKAGRTDAAAKAALSHTGSLAGSDEVLDAAFRRVGVLRVNAIEELFDMAEVLGKQPRPRGPRLALVTNAGGPAVLATDMLVRGGGTLAELSPATRTELDKILPSAWSHNNPVDILGDADSRRYADTIELLSQDPNNDGLLVVLTPQAMTEASATATALQRTVRQGGKPILASWMGGPTLTEAQNILNAAQIPTFAYPDTAARAFVYMWRYSENLRMLYETPSVTEERRTHSTNNRQIERLIHQNRKAGRTLLSRSDAAHLLEAYGIPCTSSRLAATETEAIAAARDLRFPVVLKLHSKTITHKTDVGGVMLNLRTPSEVRKAFRSIRASVKAAAGEEHFQGVSIEPMLKTSDGYELIIGSSCDPQFGPVLLFGMGGALVEVFKDRALGLPPLNVTLARRLIEQTQIYRALRGVRGRPPVDQAALERLLVRFSQLVVEQPWIKEIDINPLLALPDRLMALDVRMVLHGPEVTAENLPQLAIRPYPIQYVSEWKLRDGTSMVIRPIRPEDEPQMVQFHSSLSERSVYYRYFRMFKLDERIAHERLTRICFNDYDREMALVGERHDVKTGGHEIIGVGRLSKTHGANEAEFALVVADKWQNRGLGSELLRRLIQIGRDEKLSRIQGAILPDNHEMQRVCERAGFTIHRALGEPECQAEIWLEPSEKVASSRTRARPARGSRKKP